MKLVRVFRYDRSNRLLRIARLVWDRGEVGRGGYSNKLSIGMRPCLATIRRECDGWIVTFLGVRLHYQRAYGGRFAH